MDRTTCRDIAVAPLWAGVNLLLAVAAWRLARRLFPDDDEDQLVVHAIVAAWACITGSAMVLGCWFQSCLALSFRAIWHLQS